MKKFLFFILTLFISGLSSLSGQINSFTRGDNHIYRNPTPGKIPIMAFTPVPEGLEPTKQNYQEVLDCGFNLVAQTGSYNFYLKQFDILDDLELKFIVSATQLWGEYEATYINNIKRNKHFAGWILKDEPTYEFLPTLKRQYDTINRLDPDNFKMINLVGVVEKTFTGPYTSFNRYLDYIQQTFRPLVWSYDYYPILIKNGSMIVKYDEFFSALENFRNISIKTDRPFWAFCESMAYHTKSYSRPDATEPYLSFEAFSALAYGAQGIIYWTYGWRKSYGSEIYTSALVDKDGRKTKAWYAAQKVNQKIKKYNEVFYGCKVKSVKHTGNKTYQGTTKLRGSFGPFKNFSSGSSGVLVSDIENRNGEYIVIVNHDVKKKQSVNFILSEGKNVRNISSDAMETYESSRQSALTLEPGGCIVLKLLM